MKKTNNKYTRDNRKRIYTTIALITLLMLIVISSALVKGVSITEIMFNPQGSDTGREWIEITLNASDGCINLSQYKLFEADTNHKIYSYNSDIACNSAIICSDTNGFLQDYPYLNNTILSIYKSTFSLSNSGEEISLKLNNTIIDSVNYTSILLHTEVPEGYTLEKRGNAWNGSIYAGGDPGDFIEKAILELNSSTNTINESIQQNVTEANLTRNITSNITSNISINITNNSTGNESIDSINAINNSTSAEFNTTDSTTNISTNVSVNVSMNTSANTSLNIPTNISSNESMNASTNISANISTNISINTSANTSVNISINVSINISTNISSNTSTNTSNISKGSKCWAALNIIIKNETIIYDNGLPIKFYNKINFTVINYSSNTSSLFSGTLNYTIDYWIEDLAGNIVKNTVSTNNQDEKTFTPKIDETDKILLIKNILRDVDCNITNRTYEKMLIIRNRNYTPYVCAKTVCPKCTETANTAKCAGYIDYNIGLNSIIYRNNCTQKPLIKILKECNETETVSKRIPEQGINNNTPSVYISTTTNKTNNSKNQNLATGMIIYESPNLQNRFYALMGLVIVVLICTIIITYRYFSGKRRHEPVLKNDIEKSFDQ